MSGVGLKRTLLRAIGWSAAIKIGFQMLSWGVTLLVIRLLSPADYGLNAIAQVSVGILLGVADIGLSKALIREQDPPIALARSVFGLVLAIAVSLALLLALAAWPIAGIYADPRLVPLVQVTGLALILDALCFPPRTVLARQMRLRPVFLAEPSAGLLGGVTSLLLAWWGFGVWALMLGSLIGALGRLGAFVLVGREHWVWPV